MSAPPLILERVTRTALLGIRFWDRVSGRSVANGLELAEVRHGIRARPSRSGVFVFHDLPGFGATAAGAGDEPFWASLPAARELTFEFVDRERRFLPFRFDAETPTRGVFAEDCGMADSPPSAGIAGVPLFSAPTRLPPSGMAAVRADLWDLDADAPAAWAVLEVAGPGAPTYRAIADERGCVLAMLPYPEPPWHGGSPPAGSGTLLEQTWSLDVAVRYAPFGASPPLPSPGSGVPPDLCTVLQQDPAVILEAVSPATPLTAATLAFGRELVLRTPGRSVLLVSPV